MKTEILFLDAICNKPYNFDSLENDSLGGTEGSVIRVSEGLAKKGHQVIVCQRHPIQPSESPNGVTYAPWSWSSVIKPDNVIHLRTRNYVQAFPDSKQYIWMHDAADTTMNQIADWPDHTDPYGAKYIAVSDWHVQNLKQFSPKMNATRIYPPIDESFVTYPKSKTYDKNQLVWMSSPHKGLDGALEAFQELLKSNPEFKLIVFNPGYHEPPQVPQPRVVYLSKCSRKNMRSIISQSLCVFFPTMYEETFGMFAAEANALGTPVACYKNAALAESCINLFAKNQEDLLDMVYDWHTNGKPTPSVQERFLWDNIYPDWAKLLGFSAPLTSQTNPAKQ